jgi:hypothetical protein
MPVPCNGIRTSRSLASAVEIELVISKRKIIAIISFIISREFIVATIMFRKRTVKKYFQWGFAPYPKKGKRLKE